jgi:hypothetical protein
MESRPGRRQLGLKKETVRRLSERQLQEVDVAGASGGTCPYCAIPTDADTYLCSKAVVGTCFSAQTYC